MGFSAGMAAAAPTLRLVQVPGAGLDRIDPTAIRPGVWLGNAYGHETGIAECILGAMIALARSFARLDANLRKGRWDSQWAAGTGALPLWPELASKTLGILEFGRIGQAVARRAAAFDSGYAPSVVRPRPNLRTGWTSSGGPIASAMELENVIMTPHVSGSTEGMFHTRAQIIAENIARTARGEAPINAVTAHA